MNFTPVDHTPFEDNLIVIHINLTNKNCLVRKEQGGKSFVCELADWLIGGIQLMDYVKVSRGVNGKLIVTDYYVNTSFYDEKWAEVVQ